MTLEPIQLGVFLFITGLIAFVTYWKCKDQPRSGDSNREYFLAGGGLSWIFIAGSITLTNLSTDQLVGMNGSQMLLLAWWELAAVVGLFILALVFVPIYYKYNCTTTTELLEKRYNDKHIRATISVLFLLGNIFIFLPVVLYTGSRFMLSMFTDTSNVVAVAQVAGEVVQDVSQGFSYELFALAVAFALVGAAYTVFGGLRAVAVSDTFSGILLLGLALLVTFLALQAIHFDFSNFKEPQRLSMIGNSDSPIPWHTLFTGMLLIQIFYWSTNQVITQRAMAAPTVREAKKGVIAAAAIRLLIVPPIIVIPGVVAFQLFGEIPNDGAYGRIVRHVLPVWLSGAFAAAIAAAVLTTFNSILNSSVALYVCDIHEKYFNEEPNVPKLSGYISIMFIGLALVMVPIYSESKSIIDTIQKLFGLLSMPILSTFIVGLLFKNVNAKAAIIAVIFGTLFYGFFLFDANFKDIYMSLTQEGFEAAKHSVGYGTEVFRFISSPFVDQTSWFEVVDGVEVPTGLRLPHYIHLMFINFFFCIAVALFVNKFFFKQKAKFVLGQPLLT